MFSPDSPLYAWGGLNRALFLWLNGAHARWWDALMLAATHAGGAATYPYWVAAALLVALLRPRSLPQLNAVAFAVGFVATGLLVPWLKWTLHFPRPSVALGTAMVTLVGPAGLGASFPSGHATFAALMATALGMRAAPALRWGLWLFAALVALSRVALGAHFPADVVGGLLIGAAVGLAVRFALALVQRVRRLAA